MPIQYRCPQCNQLLSISTKKAGHEVPCPRCRTATIVPKSQSDVPAGDVPPGVQPIQSAAFQDVVQHPEAFNHTVETSPAEVTRQEPLGSALPPEPVADEPEKLRDEPGSSGEEPAAEAPDDLGGFQLRKANPDLGDLDLTSMVDVTFLLLIFFMVTASFSLQKTIEVPTPKQDQKGAAQSLTIEDLQANTIFVKIDERNGIFIDDAPSGDPGKLADALTSARMTTLRTEVAIDAHPEALHETVVLVIDAATAAGMQKIRIVSRTGGAE